MKSLPCCLLFNLLLLAGCRQKQVESTAWSHPEEVARSADSLSSSFSLYRWNNSFLAIGGEDGTFAVRRLDEDETRWITVRRDDLGCIPMDCDSRSTRVVITRGVAEPDKIDMSFVVGVLKPDGSLQDCATNSLIYSKTAFFKTRSTNVVFQTSRLAYSRPFAGGVIGESEIYVPYSFDSDVVLGKQTYVGPDNPRNFGVFCSRDSGRSWQIEHVSDFGAFITRVCKTETHYHYFAGDTYKKEIQYSLKKPDETSWPAPTPIKNARCPSGVNLLYEVASEADTVHLIWLDRRHEQKRLNLVYPDRGNYEVAYTHRKDSDSDWSKESILSSGLLYAYSPSISVERDRIVVAWAGARNAKDGHNKFDPNDIYFATSKDGGKTWTPPRQVTYGFKAGITSGMPQVALHRGVIHLFYVQGKLNFKSVSAGMVKLNQPPWPIYYQQRPFPD